MKVDINKIFELKASILNKQVELIKGQPNEIKGRARETLIQDFLEPFLPENLGVSTGAIFSMGGESSGELDIIIYDRLSYSMFKPFSEFMPKKLRPFPPECVYSIIEIENDLKEDDLERIIKKIQKVKKFPKKSFYPQVGLIHRTNFYDKEYDYFPILGILFCLDSSNLENIYKKIAEINISLSIPIEEQIDLVVVLNKGLVTPYNEKIKKIDFPQNKDTKIKIVIGTPEQNLRLFYLALMKILSQAWTRPISVLTYFQEEDKENDKTN